MIDPGTVLPVLQNSRMSRVDDRDAYRQMKTNGEGHMVLPDAGSGKCAGRGLRQPHRDGGI